jgi:hypothetical protein
MSRRSMERLSGGQGVIPIGNLSDRTPAEWSDLIRTDPHKAANDIDAVANRERARGDKLRRLTAALREDAADRLRDRQSLGRNPDR